MIKMHLFKLSPPGHSFAMIHQSSINVEVDEEPLYPLTWQFTVVLQLLHGAPAGRVLEPHPALRLLRDPGGRLHGRLGHPLPAEVARPLFQGMHQNIYHLPFHHNLLRPLTLSYTSKVLMLWCECLKVSDTPLNAIKVIMRWIYLFLYLSILNCFIFSPGSEWGLLGGGGKQWREHQHAAAQLKPQPVQ